MKHGTAALMVAVAGILSATAWTATPPVFVRDSGAPAYFLEGAGGGVILDARGVSFRVDGAANAAAGGRPCRFRMVFDGAAAVPPEGRGGMPPAAGGRAAASSVWYVGLYPGIDLELLPRPTGVKYNFHVAPGADWRAIRIRYEGIERLGLGGDGSLQIHLPGRGESLTDSAPYIYQETNDGREALHGAFVLHDCQTTAFDILEAYDNTRGIVIDPEVVWSSYMGGALSEYSTQLAVGLNGNVCVAGYTVSSGWVNGGWDVSLNGSGDLDGYVVMFSNSGSHLWSTYIGGEGAEYANGVACDSDGNVYVTGGTRSSGWVQNGFDTTFNGGTWDGYVLKLGSLGGHIWSTYLGGSGNADKGNDIAIDSTGAVLVAGATDSIGWISGGWDIAFGGSQDGFVLKIDPDGEMQWSTYLGEASLDYSKGVACDLYDNVYVCGDTQSTGWVSGGWITTYCGGASDSYVVKLSPLGEHEWSTYLGGGETEYCSGIDADVYGNSYTTGSTSSDGWIGGGWDSTYGGGPTYGDSFIVKLGSSGTHAWSTYLGGSSDENTSYGGICVDNSGSVFATGATNSNGWVSGGYATSLQGSRDAYIIKLLTNGSHAWSGYIGSTSVDFCSDVTIDDSGTIFVTGITYSSGWMVGGWDVTFGGGSWPDSFALSISQEMDLPYPPSMPQVLEISMNTATWSWQDNSDTELGFSMWADLGAGPPITLQATTAANVTSWEHTGLSVNTQYAFQVSAANANGDSVRTGNLAAYTAIEPVSAVVFSNVGTNVIDVSAANTPSNLSSGLSGLYFEANTSAGANSGWKQDHSPWVTAGLLPNTAYTFGARSRNGDAAETSPCPEVVKYTLASVPLPPQVAVPTNHLLGVHALDFVIGLGDGNPAATLYAVQVDPPVGAHSWVQADGTLGASPVYRTSAAWDARRVTGLAKARAYTFTVTARNGEGLDTVPGPGATLSTADNLPPSAPVLSFPAVQSDGGNLVCSVVFPSVDPEGDTVYYAYDWHVKRFGAPDFALFRDGAPAASLSDQINNVDTLPDDLWYCAVTAYDGEDLGMPALTPQCQVVLGGVIPSFISLGVNPVTVTLGQQVTALGQLFPTPFGSGTVAFTSVSPSGVSSSIFPEGTVFSGGAYTKSFYPSEASEGRGPWTLASSWPGDSTYQSASSTPVSFTVQKAQPSLTLTLSANSAPLGYADLSANAALSAGFPAELRPLLSGMPVYLWVKKPDASSAGPVLGTTDAAGTAHFPSAAFASAGVLLTAPGTWQFTAEFEGDANLRPAVSAAFDQPDSVRLTVKDRAGYAVVVVGRLDELGEGLASHAKTGDYVYRSLRDRGFAHEDIYYLRRGPAQPAADILVDDTTPSKADVAWAVTEWARDAMNASPAPLYVVFIDHGGVGKFYVHDGAGGAAREITPFELDGWLDTLEGSLIPEAQSQDRVFVYGACHAGSFIPGVSAPGRVVMASCRGDEVSHRGVVDPSDGVRNGEAFLTEFFRNAREGRTLRASFEAASGKIQEYTATRSNGAQAESLQHPLLDDNGDGAGTAGPLSDTPGQDGGVAHALVLGYGVNAGSSAGWLAATQTLYLGPTDPVGTLHARPTRAPEAGDRVWIEVKSPSYAGSTVVDPANPESQEAVDLGQHEYTHTDAGWYAWDTSVLGAAFAAPGTYKVFYYLQDGTQSDLPVCAHLVTTVYRGAVSNQPPAAVVLLYPGSGALVSAAPFFAWSSSVDPEGDAVTYVLEVSGDAGFSALTVEREVPTGTVAQLTVADGLVDGQGYFWRVIPVDAYGASPAVSDARFFTVDANNPDLPGAISGVVRDAATRAAVPNATVLVSPGNRTAVSGSDGSYFVANVPPGTYMVDAGAAGYASQRRNGTVVVSQGLTTAGFDLVSSSAHVWGDVSADGRAGTVDASQIKQWRVGIIESFPVSPSLLYPAFPAGADVSGDGACGTLDASLLLQKRVGLITCFPADTNCDGSGPDAKKGLSPRAAAKDGETERVLSLGVAVLDGDGAGITVPVVLDDASGVVGYYLELSFDTARLAYAGAAPGALTAGWEEAPVVNAGTGRLRIASAGVDAASGGGELVVLSFDLVAPGAAPDPLPAQVLDAELNDGAIPVRWENGSQEGEPDDDTAKGCRGKALSSRDKDGLAKRLAHPDALLLLASLALMAAGRGGFRKPW